MSKVVVDCIVYKKGVVIVPALQAMTKQELAQRITDLRKEYETYKAKNLSLDMSRGKPGADQLDLTLGLLDCVNARDGFCAENGFNSPKGSIESLQCNLSCGFTV